MTHRSVEQLKLDFPDGAWQAKYAQICDIVEILGDCTIADTYVISDDLNKAVALTSAGTSIRDRLVTKEGVHPKEAKLMCALAVGHGEIFIDVEKTDVDALAASVSAEITGKRIRFPFIFGRELYNRYAELHEEQKDSLTADESIKLMDGLPLGVFQYGKYTLGPYGLKAAPTARSLQSIRHVPAYHCSQTTCRRIHPVLLETSRVAEINRERAKLDDLLRSMPGDAAEWWPFAAEVSGHSAAYYGDQQSATIIPLVGDALAIDELRSLLADLLDSNNGELRSATQSILKVGSASEAVKSLGRAEILQLILHAHEEHIASSLDRLVRAGTIVVPQGEVRRAVVTQMMKSGAFGLRAELGVHGVRFASEDPGLALLRERRLLERLYLRDAETDVAELEWQLRGIEIDDIDERLGHFFHTTGPRQAISRMALARKTNMITACAEVGLEDAAGMADEVLVDTFLWKLGFQVVADDDPHADFWRQHERLWALTQSSEIGASERFRDSASPYFSLLEGLLLDSLAFTAWAFLTDHTTAAAPFSYDDEQDRNAGLALMNQIAPSPSGTSHYLSDRVDLGNLIGGFSALARRLTECVASQDDCLRPIAEIPDYDGKTTIKAFLLRSTVPFVDLTTPSQTRIVEGLKEITRVLAEAEVNLVRNDYSHYRRNAPDISRVEKALEATRQAVTRVETLGFCRLLFTPTGITRDAWGRSQHEFSGPRSYEHTFVRPTQFDWMGLPSLADPAYLVRSAAVGEPSEVLRFTRRYGSAYSHMWQGYPDRRRPPRTASTDALESHEAQVDGHVGP